MARTPTPVAQPDEQAPQTAETIAPTTADAAANPVAPEAPQTDPEALIEVRVLADVAGFAANTLARLRPDQVAAHAGQIDADPAAVAFVKSLGV